MHVYYLSLGGNLDAENSLPAAVGLLRRYGVIRAASPVYETPAFGTSDPQPNYLNAAVVLESEIPPVDFQRNVIASIESELGRVRTADKFAARTIDIDIMLVDNDVMMIGHRPIPSPEILERVFVALPLAEIAPDYIHPTTGEPLQAIAARLQEAARPLQLRTDVRLPRE